MNHNMWLSGPQYASALALKASLELFILPYRCQLPLRLLAHGQKCVSIFELWISHPLALEPPTEGYFPCVFLREQPFYDNTCESPESDSIVDVTACYILFLSLYDKSQWEKSGWFSTRMLEILFLFCLACNWNSFGCKISTTALSKLFFLTFSEQSAYAWVETKLTSTNWRIKSVCEWVAKEIEELQFGWSQIWNRIDWTIGWVVKLV